LARSNAGTFGTVTCVIGIALLLFTFVVAYLLLHNEVGIDLADITSSMNNLLYAAVQGLFLGIMGWVGSILLLRGIEFMKVEKGIGVVTFKVEKGVGIVTQQVDGEESKDQSPREEQTTESKGA
jgi:hypothetical protein